VGYLVGYTEENSYLICWVPEKRKVVTAVSVDFDERIPEHKEAYWGALTQPSEVNIPTGDVADFKYLVGLRYVDPDFGCTFETTRVVVEKGLIVAYRVPVKRDGTRTTIEESHPMHVKDVVQMVTAPTVFEPSGQGNASQQNTKPVDLRKSTVSSRKRKRLITSKSTRTIVPLSARPKVIKASSKRSKYVSRPIPTVSRMRRIRTQRTLMNAARLGNVGYTT